MSSVASVSGFKSGSVPQKVISPFSNLAMTGYGQSKQVAEQILAHASEYLGISVTILRVGQVACTLNPRAVQNNTRPWSPDDWIPVLVRSSYHLRYLPQDLPVPVDWLPSDVLADTVLDILLHELESGSPRGANVFNLLNPESTTWKALMNSVVAALMKQERDSPPLTEIKMIDFSDWISKIKRMAEQLSNEEPGERMQQMDVVRQFPAVKLLPFFEDLEHYHEIGFAATRFETTNAEAMSPSLREVGTVQPRWMEKWISEWNLQ